MDSRSKDAPEGQPSIGPQQVGGGNSPDKTGGAMPEGQPGLGYPKYRDLNSTGNPGSEPDSLTALGYQTVGGADGTSVRRANDHIKDVSESY